MRVAGEQMELLLLTQNEQLRLKANSKVASSTPHPEGSWEYRVTSHPLWGDGITRQLNQ